MATAPSSLLRRKLANHFKLQGLSLKSDAASFLVEVLRPYDNQPDIDDIIDQIGEAIQRQPLQSALVPRDVVEVAVEECNQASDSDSERALTIIDAFSTPKFAYNPDRKKFLPVPKASLKLHSNADAKASLFKERYTLLHQRTLRHELFTPPAPGQAPVEAASSKFQLRSVEFLLSSSGLPDRVIVLGMLSQLREGKFFLEDPTGTVEVDLAQCSFHTGLFTESSIVLAEGTYSDKLFHLSAVGFPPPETAEISRRYFGNVNFFGGPSAVCAKASVKLDAMLRENQDAVLVFISDVFLDDQRVMEKLSTLFYGYSDAPPAAFVLLGNFSSAPFGPKRNQRLQESFKSLGDLILKFPTLVDKSQFLFVPGPQDPGPGNVLPRPPIPSGLTADLTSRIPGAQCCSNPLRLQFCSREIVVFREDITSKLCRNCVRFPSKTADMSEHLVKTLLSQAHLCPLPLHKRPIYWAHDHALRLYPLPDLVVVGDKSDPFTETAHGCTVVNSGSFLRTGFEFKVYVPASHTVEDSKITE